MIHEAKETLVDAGAVLLSSYNDGTGVWGYHVRIEGHTFILVAKQFDYKEHASFLEEAVERAAGNDGWLLFYSSSDGSYTVFDPKLVVEDGSRSEGHSKTRWAQWFEVPMVHGVDLVDFIKRHERPGSVDETKPTGIHHFTEG